MSLDERSSHLGGVLRRTLSPYPEELFEDVFEYALQTGGEDECGFSRQPEVSFNPKCARLGLILLQDGGIREPLLVASGILSASAHPEGYGGSEAEALTSQLRDLHSDFPTYEDVNAPLESPANRLRIIRAALCIDLGRHLHQIAKPESVEYLSLFLGDASAILNDPRGIPVKMLELVKHIYSRYSVGS